MAFADIAVAAFGGDLLGGAALDAGIGAAADWGGAATLADAGAGIGAAADFGGAATLADGVSGSAGGGLLGSLTKGQMLGAGTSLANGLMSANASQGAASAQVASGNRAIDAQQGMYNQTRQSLQPYMQGGNMALSSLSGKFADGSLGGNFTAKDYMDNRDPGYQFQLEQGRQALENSQAAGDGALSGSALKGMINYNQGMASTGYQNAYSRWMGQQQNTYGQLHDTAAIGENAAAGAGTVGASYSNSIGNTMTGIGNAQASGMVGASKAYGQGFAQSAGYYPLNDLIKNGA